MVHLFMNEKLKEKIRESLTSVLPITGIVLLLSITFVPMEIGTLSLFIMGAILLVLGMGFFQLGAEVSMTPLGQGIGGQLVKSRSLIITIFVCFVVGSIITISEPDLQVLAEQVASIPNNVLIWTVALGVGVFTVIAVLRILFKISLPRLLVGLYLFLLVMTFFAPSDFISVAFDAGGVTTGPMTVPFIMAIGVGLSASRSDKDGASDSFGLIALCSIGPILMVLLLSIFYHPSEALYQAVEIAPVITTQDVISLFVRAIPQYAAEVFRSIIPVIAAFILFQLVTHRYNKRQMIRIIIGFLYTLIGLILFLTGVNVGFAPVGNLLGSSLADSSIKWIMIPIGFAIGYYIVKAEPAIKVLNEQVEEITGGTISRKMMNCSLSLGVACAVSLSMLRVLTGISIYWIIIPGYALALCLSHFVPPIFVGVAYDSGGVASGPMTSTFLLPLAMGACTALGGNVVTDAFGIVALVALTPLIAIQVMGLIYSHKAKLSTQKPSGELSDDIILEYREERQ